MFPAYSRSEPEKNRMCSMVALRHVCLQINRNKSNFLTFGEALDLSQKLFYQIGVSVVPANHVFILMHLFLYFSVSIVASSA